MLTYFSSELHPAFSPVFNPAADEATKTAARKTVASWLDWLEAQLADGRTYLTGAIFTIADAHAFVVATWANFTGIALDAWRKLRDDMARVAARPATQATIRAEA